MELLQFTSLSNQKNSFEFVSFALLFVFWSFLLGVKVS